MSVDLTAPVTRFEVGQRVRWVIERMTHGTIVKMADDDSLYCDESFGLYAPWGTYFGRLCRVVCDNVKCYCHTTNWTHAVNECQLTDDTELPALAEDSGALF